MDSLPDRQLGDRSEALLRSLPHTPTMRLTSALIYSLISAMSALAQSQRQRTPRVLVYTATRGYRHDSIPTAIEVLGSRAADAGVQFSFTE